MSELTPNADLLRRTLAYIEEHPQEWKQDEWRCGTTACFAGHAAMLDGGRWLNGSSASMAARPDDPAYHVWSVGDVHAVFVEARARHVLGLTREQADDLFRGTNTLDDLRTIVAELCGGES